MQEQLVSLLPLIAAVAVGYLLVIRPARRRQRELLAVQRQLAPGTQVMTASGLFARVVEVAEGRVVLETGPGVHSTWARESIARVVAPADPPALDLTDRAGGQHGIGIDADADAEARRADRPGA